MTVIFHPETQGMVDVPPESVPHYRQSGWVTKGEWEEHLQAQAAAAAAEESKPAVRKQASDKEK